MSKKGGKWVLKEKELCQKKGIILLEKTGEMCQKKRKVVRKGTIVLKRRGKCVRENGVRKSDHWVKKQQTCRRKRRGM